VVMSGLPVWVQGAAIEGLGPCAPVPFSAIPTVGGTGELAVKKDSDSRCAVRLAQVQGAAPEEQVAIVGSCLASGKTHSPANETMT
jgi:hypothetical protein